MPGLVILDVAVVLMVRPVANPPAIPFKDSIFLSIKIIQAGN